MQHPVFEELEKNEQVYESLREQLEKDHRGEWVVIVNQKLVAIATTLEEADRLAEERSNPGYGKDLLLAGSRFLKDCHAVIDYRQEQTTLSD